MRPVVVTMGGEGGPGAGGPPAREELEEFLEIRRHVKRIQAGTPVLLRKAAVGGESLQICTVWVSQDLQTICWKEQEGGHAQGKSRINLIVGIEEEEDVENIDDGEDGHFELNLKLRAGPNQKPDSMSLICASPEDLTSWKEGLQFLVGSLPLEQPLSSQSAAAPAPASVNTTARPVLRGGGGSKAAAPAVTDADNKAAADPELMIKLKQQEELIAKLRQENGLLAEITKRKDASIAELMRDVQNRPTEQCSKTASTSRESDEHLKDREMTVLQGKNKRLRKELHAKQQTVKELLQTLGRLNAQYGGESSAVEDANESQDNAAESSDEEQRADSRSAARSAAALTSGTDSEVAASAGKSVRSADWQGIKAGITKPKMKVQLPAETADDDEGDDDEDQEEIAALTSKLALLENALGGMNFNPPARGMPEGSAPGNMLAALSAALGAGTLPQAEGSAPGNVLAALSAALGGGTLPQAQSMPASGIEARLAAKLAPKAVPKPVSPAKSGTIMPNERSAGAIKATQGLGVAVRSKALSQKSIAALQALDRETETFEAKKRVVEQLARTLPPDSGDVDDDDEDDEDDDFPLR